MVRVHKGRFVLQITTQAVYISATKLKFTENEGGGEHQALREAGDGAHCGREEVKLYPERIGGEVVPRRAGGV